MTSTWSIWSKLMTRLVSFRKQRECYSHVPNKTLVHATAESSHALQWKC